MNLASLAREMNWVVLCLLVSSLYRVDQASLHKHWDCAQHLLDHLLVALHRQGGASGGGDMMVCIWVLRSWLSHDCSVSCHCRSEGLSYTDLRRTDGCAGSCLLRNLLWYWLARVGFCGWRKQRLRIKLQGLRRRTRPHWVFKSSPWTLATRQRTLRNRPMSLTQAEILPQEWAISQTSLLGKCLPHCQKLLAMVASLWTLGICLGYLSSAPLW